MLPRNLHRQKPRNLHADLDGGKDSRTRQEAQLPQPLSHQFLAHAPVQTTLRPMTERKLQPQKPPPRRNLKAETKAAEGPGCLRRLLGLLLVLLFLGAGALGLTWYWLDATLPDVFTFEAYRQVAKESSRVVAASGEVIALFGDEIRTVVPPERIPAVMRSAMVSAEDASFYSHPGLDVLGIARAIWTDIVRGHYAQGASTITQQLAKTRFLDRTKTVTRKAKELVLARKLEQKLSKDEILTLYLNEVYFGHGRYGVEEAARFYFGKSVSQVDVAEAALLAGIVNSPLRFSPLRHPEAAKERRQYVLGQLLKHGYIDQAAHDRAVNAPLPQVAHDNPLHVGPWYAEAVRRFVLEKVDRETLASAGLRIEVALDVATQLAAELAVKNGLRRMDRAYKTLQPVKQYADETQLAEGRQKLTQQQDKTLTPGRTLLGIVLGSSAGQYTLALGTREGTLPWSALERYARPQEGEQAGAKNVEALGKLFERGDLLRVSVLEKTEEKLILSPEFGPQAALVALEPETRLVRAIVGGDDFALHPFDRAVQARRQPGSTFKTFVYGAALEAGVITPETEMKDEARTFHLGGKDWTPRNFSGRYDGQLHAMRDALAQSINSIAVGVAAQIGPQKVADFARRAGIESPLDEKLPLALGASSVSPLELINAYATIATGGTVQPPILVTRIVDRAGKDLYLAHREPGQRVLKEETAKQLTDMLGDVVRHGSGKEAQKAGRPVVGKTGTSNGGRDVWFAGFSADLCTVVWIGYDDRKPMPKATGGTLAVPMWTEFMRIALERVPVRPLPRLPHLFDAPLPADPKLAPLDPEPAGAAADEALEDPLPPVQPQLPPRRLEPE